MSEFVRTFAFFKPYRAKMVVIVLLMLLSSGLGLVPAIITGLVIDALTSRQYDHLLRDLIVLFLTGAVATVLNLYLTSLSTFVEGYVARDLRIALIDRLVYAHVRVHSDMGTGRIATRLLGDVDGLVSVAKTTVVPVATSVLVVATALVAMFAMSWSLTLLSVAVVCVTVPVGTLVGRRLGDLRATLGRFQDTFHALVIERFSPSGIALMKQAARERADLRLFEIVLDSTTKTGITSTVAATRFQSLVGFATSLGPALVLGFGGWKVTHGSMSVGMLVTFIGLQARLYGPASLLANIHVQIATARSTIARVYEILDQPTEVLGTQKVADTDIEFDDVTIVKGAAPVVRGVSLNVARGEFVAIIGASGSGKSTLLRALTRNEQLEGGTIRVGGIDIVDLRLPGLRNKVVVVPSDGFLLADSVEVNLRYQAFMLDDAEIMRLAALTGALSFIERRPDGMLTFVGFEGREFSLGERQRIALTRALLQQPEVLVLDEATSGIPLDEELRLLADIRSSTTVRTLILVTHRLSAIVHADRIVILDDGRVVRVGTPDEILSRSIATIPGLDASSLVPEHVPASA